MKQDLWTCGSLIVLEWRARQDFLFFLASHWGAEIQHTCPYTLFFKCVLGNALRFSPGAGSTSHSPLPQRLHSFNGKICQPPGLSLCSRHQYPGFSHFSEIRDFWCLQESDRGLSFLRVTDTWGVLVRGSPAIPPRSLCFPCLESHSMTYFGDWALTWCLSELSSTTLYVPEYTLLLSLPKSLGYVHVSSRLCLWIHITLSLLDLLVLDNNYWLSFLHTVGSYPWEGVGKHALCTCLHSQ